MFEPEKKDVSIIDSSSERKSGKIKSERQNEARVKNLDRCTCRNIKNNKTEIDCLGCQEVNALNEIFQNKQLNCAAMCEEFKTLCLHKIVLKNDLTELHETREDPIENNFSNWSLTYAAYK